MTHPRGWIDRCLASFLPDGPASQAVRGDLIEEHRRRSADRPVAASAWYATQAVSVAFWALLDRARGRAWRGGRGPHSLSPEAGRRFEPTAAVLDGVRVFRRDPGYAASVVVTLGLALATTVTVFTAVRGILIHDLPYPGSDRIVQVDRTVEGEDVEGAFSYPDYQDLRDGLGSYEAMLARSGWEGTYTADGVAEVWSGIAVTPRFLDVFGLQPAAGTVLDEATGAPGSHSLMVSWDLWQRRFGGSDAVVGRSILVDEEPWTIVGVLPRDFEYPEAGIDVAAPLSGAFMENRGANFVRLLGRLEPGRSIAAATEETSAMAESLFEAFGEPAGGAVVRSYARTKVAPVRRLLLLLMGAVGLVLVVACANVSGLALARVEARRQELSVRRALGAGRGRLLRQMFAESLAVALAGGVVGLAGAVIGVRLLLSLAPPDLPRREMIAVDPAVGAFAVVVAILAGLLFGILPALRGASAPSQAALRTGRGGSVDGRRTQEFLVGAQIAVAVVLLAGSALLVRSFSALNGVDPGFATSDRLAVQVGLTPARYPGRDEILTFHDRLMERVEAMPGTGAVGLSTHLPFSPSRIEASVVREGEVYRRGEVETLSLEMHNGDYFGAIGLTVLRGRAPTGDPAERNEVVLNEAAALLLFPGDDPLGRRFSFDVEEGRMSADSTLFTVVGVVPSVRKTSLDEEVTPVAYYALPDFSRLYSFSSGRYFELVVETSGDPDLLVEPIRAALLELDPTLPVRDVRTLASMVRTTTLAARFRSTVLGVFSILAVGLAFVGLYAVMAYGVSRGRREIGIRMALGASGASVRRRVISRSAVVVATGSAAGLLAAWSGAPLLAEYLFNVTPRDPLSLVAVVAVAATGSLVAAWVPAARASAVDPVRVLRDE